MENSQSKAERRAAALLEELRLGRFASGGMLPPSGSLRVGGPLPAGAAVGKGGAVRVAGSPAGGQFRAV